MCKDKEDRFYSISNLRSPDGSEWYLIRANGVSEQKKTLKEALHYLSQVVYFESLLVPDIPAS